MDCIIDLKLKKVIATGSEIECIDIFNKQCSHLNTGGEPFTGIRCIIVHEEELITGNHYIKPNEYRIPITEDSVTKIFQLNKREINLLLNLIKEANSDEFDPNRNNTLQSIYNKLK